MVRRLRLDAELVRRQLARSREQAGELIEAGRVQVRGNVATKAATGVEQDTPIRVLSDIQDPGYASRGAHKLAGALAEFATLRVSGRRCLDAGASTGGFTDVLLRNGAREVVAVDVGYGQLVWALQSDPRVIVHDRTNVRTLTPEQIGGLAELTVADLSFISLGLVLPALTACTVTDLVPMVKPQFEVGRQRLGRGGVVREPALRAEAVLAVAGAALELGWGTAGLARSPLPGPSGNVEFFLWLRQDAGPADPARIHAIAGEGE
ncbi:MAG TPA: TlyA family RNA methyltransferase [Jatrophihabitans sp.]|jgi:23S rRNA (cytidine1920-2'-O)/16S rRNA (cytidine1409-2'-O)-methyltransferase|uniref:TlyA family RNA methyltransferase n=1 Tax=Jatrophihabitans sp. TaxID=1932789 RepID=UPI002F1EAD47